ncbi:hypothetical protein [Arthrobacter sp. CJ23]|uniref:hypothetical protein n=1 Tax=Arthrobacter sp. CJ23 TaxID=2972479 RepID=UPI00215CAB70|nr:hypothetical protein [Arthrobacter sp. CJ23]UVJ40177.1 hypothetical protein NVV90_03020 [Arthrobacter sp. CJ23]
MSSNVVPDDEEAGWEDLPKPAGKKEWRYGPKDRVVLSARALLLGAAVAHVVFVIALSATTGMAGQWFLILLVYSALPVWIVAIAAAMALGAALRRVRNQWIHVAAFFLAAAFMCVPFGGFTTPYGIAFSLSVALAAGIARLAVWRLVRINDPLPPLAS